MGHGQDETADTIEANNLFPVPVLAATDSSGVESNDIVIIVNGFNEPNVALSQYWHHKFGLCPLLKRLGISAAFVPLTFHYWRKPTVGIYAADEFTPGHMVNQHKIRFYLGYRQLIGDLTHIAQLLDTNRKADDLAGLRPLKVHLMGFSLGGLASLSAYLTSQLNKSNLFASCTLLFSGSNLLSVGTRGSGLSRTEVQEFQQYYLSRRYEDEFAPALDWRAPEEITRLSIFKYVFLGDRDVESVGPQLDPILNLLRDGMDRIPVIVGENDSINKLQQALEFIPPNSTHLLIHTEPRVRHFLWRDPAWAKGGSESALQWWYRCMFLDSMLAR